MKRVKSKDTDNPPLTERQLSRMRPAAEVLPDIVKAARGRPKLDAPKELVTLRLDADLVSHFRGKGSGWRTVINDTLRKAARLKKRA
jgi:uncharacterized protein (DUF4415 family)